MTSKEGHPSTIRQRSHDDCQERIHFLSKAKKHLKITASDATSGPAVKKKGTMSGVFLPCMQSILNIILFLRLPSITSQAGTIQTTIIILACASSTIMTAVSLSAISTNGDIMRGGPYYVISRTLGLEVGGALGLLYYFGSTMASSLCVLGGVEAFLLSIRGDEPVYSDLNGGALGGSYEAVDSEVIGDGLARKLLETFTIGDEDSIEQMVELAEEMNVPVASGPMDVSGDFLVLSGGTDFNVIDSFLDTQNLSLLLVLFLTIFVKMGLYRQSSTIFLVLMLGCILSACLGVILFAAGYYKGDLESWDKILFDNIHPHYQDDLETKKATTFMSLFALFYPSVTGILTGSNNSQILEDPGRSIPRGTISAIVVTTSIYILVVWLFGSCLANRTLKERKFVFAAVAYPTPMIVKVGVLVSVFGAALSFMQTATGILSAIATDDSMPILNFVRKGNFEKVAERKKGEIGLIEERVNKRALVITWFLVSLPTLSGNLDHITPLTTMCFLLMYSGINFSCFLLSVTGAAGFRPSFKFYHWTISALGFIWCLCLALIIDATMACLALIIFLCILMYNNKMKEAGRVETRRDFGDVFDSVKFSVLTGTLNSLSATTTHDLNAKNWRPQLLTFVDMDRNGMPTNLHLLSLASQMSKGKGINIVVGVILRDLLSTDLRECQGMDKESTIETIAKSKNILQQHMVHERLDGFSEVSVTTREGMCDAVWSAILHSGLGPLSPNTILLPYPSKEDRNGPVLYWSEGDFVKVMMGIKNMNYSLMIMRGCGTYPKSRELVSSGVIDVWWIIHDGGLLLLIPYIISKNAIWGTKGAKLRIFAVKTRRTDDSEMMKKAVSNHLKKIRIQSTVFVVDLSCTSIAEDMKNGVFCDDATNAMDVEEGDVKSQKESNDDESKDFSSSPARYTNRRISNAKAFNEILVLHSSCSNLVVINMPTTDPNNSSHFFDYIDTMCEGVDNVLLVRGSGKELVTRYV